MKGVRSGKDETLDRSFQGYDIPEDMVEKAEAYRAKQLLGPPVLLED